MTLSAITGFTSIPERSEATPGLFNTRLQQIQDNVNSLYSNVSTFQSVLSGPQFFDPKAYGALADGSTNDATGFAAAVSAASAVRGTVLLSSGTYRLASQQTVPFNVTVFPGGGRLALDSGVRLAMQGSVVPLPKPWITSGSTGSVVFDIWGPVTDVRPEWWGASAASTDATAVDNYTPIQNALNTGKAVVLGPGIYGVNLTNQLVTKANGQTFRGQGSWVNNSDQKGGTKLLRISTGTADILDIGALNDQRVIGMTFDGNSIGTLVSDTGIRTHLEDLRFQRAGPTQYCLFVNQNNLCYYEHLYFPDTIDGSQQTSGGHMSFLTALYTHVVGAQMGRSGGQQNVTIAGSTGLAFRDCYADPTNTWVSIKIAGTNRDITFDGLNLESVATGAPMVLVDATGADTRGVRFKNVRTLQSANSSAATSVFRLVGGASRLLSQVQIDNWTHEDLQSGSTRTLIDADGLQQLDIRNCEVYSTGSFAFADFTGTRSDYVNIENLRPRSGTGGQIMLKCAQVRVARTDLDVLTATGTDNFIGENIGGLTNVNNVATAATLLECNTVTNANAKIRLGSRNDGISASFVTAAPSQTSGSFTFYQDSSGSLFLLANYAGSQRSVRLF